MLPLIPYDIAKFLILGAKSNTDVFRTLKKPIGNNRCTVTHHGLVETGRIKRVSAKFGVRFSTVSFSMLTGAIRKEILRQGQKLDHNMIIHFPIHLPGHTMKLRNTG